MSKTTIEEIKTILAEVVSAIDWSALEPDQSLSELGLDSLDKASFVMKLEEAAGVTIPDEDYENLDTAAEFVDYISGK